MGFIEPTKFTWVVEPTTGKRTKKAARDTKWKARYRDPNGADRRQTFDRKADAELFLQRNGTEIQNKDWVQPELKRTSFGQWTDAWWETTAKLAPSTRRGYERNLRLHIKPAFEGRPIAAIDWMVVEQMSAVDTSGVEPLYTPLSAVQEVTLRLRADEVTETNRRDANQRSAPAVEDGLFLVPKVIGA